MSRVLGFSFVCGRRPHTKLNTKKVGVSGVLGFSFLCGQRPHTKLHRRTDRTVRRWPLE